MSIQLVRVLCKAGAARHRAGPGAMWHVVCRWPASGTAIARRRRLRLLGGLLLLMQLRQQVQKGSVCRGAKATAVVWCPSSTVLAAVHASAEHARRPAANPAGMQVLRLQALDASKKTVAWLLRVLWLPIVGCEALVASYGVQRPCSAAGQPAAGAPDAGRSEP